VVLVVVCLFFLALGWAGLLPDDVEFIELSSIYPSGRGVHRRPSRCDRNFRAMVTYLRSEWMAVSDMVAQVARAHGTPEKLVKINLRRRLAMAA